MIRNKKHSSVVLAGVSFVALTMATGSAWAAGQQVTVSPLTPSWVASVNGNGNNDFIEFLNVDIDEDVIIDQDVGGGRDPFPSTDAENPYGILLNGNTVIGDDLIVEMGVYVTGNDFDIGTGFRRADAVGIDVVPSAEIGDEIYNEGFVGGYAESKSTTKGSAGDAQAYAYGARMIEDDDPQFTNTLTGEVVGFAYASAFDDATASAYGIFQETDEDAANASVINDGSIDAVAIAKSAGDRPQTNATADATAVNQGVEAGDGLAAAVVDNSLDIHARSFAEALSSNFRTADAEAGAIGVRQWGLSEEEVQLDIFNNDPLSSIVASATAIANANIFADAEAFATGASQYGEGDNDVRLTIDNHGDLMGTAEADVGTTINSALAGAASAGARGSFQGGEASDTEIFAKLINSATGRVVGIADATIYAERAAQADAEAIGADQELFGDNADVFGTVDNAGIIGGYAMAYASSTRPSFFDADATATATGIDQYGNTLFGGGGSVSLVVSNTGNVYGEATATARGVGDDAEAEAFAMGIEQDAFAESDASGLTTNWQLISALASADATADESAEAYASATGVGQRQESDAGEATATVDNFGSILATALASADAEEDDAYAEAQGFGVNQQVDSDNEFGTADVYNVGWIIGSGFADAFSLEEDADANAVAFGIIQDVDQDDGDGLATVTNDNWVEAYADAWASGYEDAFAEADATGIDQFVETTNDATAEVFNTAVVTAFAYAEAKSFDDREFGDNYEARASVDVEGINQKVESFDEYAEALVRNTGVDSAIVAFGSAMAESLYGEASVFGQARGVDQDVDTQDRAATADVYNEGLISAFAIGTAITRYDENAEAEVDVFGIQQDADSEGDRTFATATAYVDNSGKVFATGTAIANVFDPSYAGSNGSARADVDVEGIEQDVDTEDSDVLALAWIDNSGLVQALGKAESFSSYSDADSFSTAKGVDQEAGDEDDDLGEVFADNSDTGQINAFAYADAQAWIGAFARADAFGIEQDAESDGDGKEATATVDNDGTIVALADAYAGGTGIVYQGATSAEAFASATGVNQNTDSDGNATSTVTNTSFFSIDVRAFAEAVGQNKAFASAVADGVDQEADAEDDALVQTFNEGEIFAFASAIARTTAGDDGKNNGFATASAYASGVDQESEGFGFSTARLDNSGNIFAIAYAEAIGSSEIATAASRGLNSQSDQDLTLDVENYGEGLIYAFANAKGNSADAFAAGAWLEVFDDNGLSGTIVNAGIISGSAYSDGWGTASAFGVVMVSDEYNETTTTNTGLISAFAEGVNASATGIAVASHGHEGDDQRLAPTGYGPTVGTINNDGGVIFAGIVENQIFELASFGEAGISRGNAINFRGFTRYDGEVYDEAPNAMVVNWTGGEGTGTFGKEFVEATGAVSEDLQTALRGYSNYGYVFGNVLLTDDDRVNITNGLTILDGNFNEDGDFLADIYIEDDGKLLMVQNKLEGASWGSVDDLYVESDGTLAFELTPENGPGDYSQINANNARIDGRFSAFFTRGFYQNSTKYNDIISSNSPLDVIDPVHGFSEVVDNSALLDSQTFVDIDDTIDLYVERIAFDQVGGMTDNQQAAGGAIESVYDPNAVIDTPFEELVSRLFTLDDGDYQLFMDQLTGAEHAEHLRSVLWSTRAINRIITERMECDTGSAYKSASATSGAKIDGNTVMPTADAPMAATGCFDPGTASVWMRGFGQWNTMDGDENAPGFDETQYGIIFGGDYAFDENWFLGIAGGYFNSDGDFNDWGGRPGTDYDYDGLQLAAYGGYDNSTYYLRGVISYGNYEGESNRLIAFQGSPIDPAGDPSSNTFSFYGETGYRFDLGAGNITPFAGLNLATATLESFTEDDPEGTGAALEIHDSDAESVASVLGLRFDADMMMGSGILTPSVSVAWMHEFADTPEVDMSFAGAPSGADFTVVASDAARDSILVDAGAQFELNGAIDFGVFYNGQFSEDYTSNAITARLGYKF